MASSILRAMNTPTPPPTVATSISGYSFQGLVELQPSLTVRPDIRLVVFDFDGTLSWLRHGWPEIMLHVFRESFLPQPGENEAQIRALLLDLIVSLTGKPTIFQMIRFADLIRERDGRTLDPELLRQEFQRRLDAEIEVRSALIRSGKARPDDFVVYQARPLLKHLQQLGLTLAILSSTIEERVREEAALLELTPFFGENIFGGTGDPTKFSKMDVFRRLLQAHNLRGAQLLSFGDGPVELQMTKELGGTAIAICTDEDHNGSGIMDEFKHRQLLAAGADASVPDFRDTIAITNIILGNSQ